MDRKFGFCLVKYLYRILFKSENGFRFDEYIYLNMYWNYLIMILNFFYLDVLMQICKIWVVYLFFLQELGNLLGDQVIDIYMFGRYLYYCVREKVWIIFNVIIIVYNQLYYKYFFQYRVFYLVIGLYDFDLISLFFNIIRYVNMLIFDFDIVFCIFFINNKKIIKW